MVPLDRALVSSYTVNSNNVTSSIGPRVVVVVGAVQVRAQTLTDRRARHYWHCADHITVRASGHG